MGNLNFNAADVAPAEAFDPLPSGWYVMQIIGAEMADGNKPEAGSMLKLEFEVDEASHPDFRGRRAWTNLCINHQKQQPREIANRQLSAIAHAVDHVQLDDTEQLLGTTLRVKLAAMPARTDEATGKTYEAKNEVKAYKSVKDETDEAPAAPAAPAKGSAPAKAPPKGAAAPAAAAGKKPSWKRGGK